MDEAYNQHASAARRKNRSTTNLNHLSLAPLTSKLPLQDDTDTEFPNLLSATPSYLQGKSAPTTPRLLSRSPGRSSHPRSRPTSVPSSTARLPKSKSATHLPPSTGGRHTHVSPSAKRHSNNTELRGSDSDWLLRAGALISAETRESKGQAWLVSRASSTSLAGLRDPDDDAFDRELALERAASRGESKRSSRQQSVGPYDDGDHASSPPYSRYGSRSQSRAGSRAGSRTQLMTPLEGRSADGYFLPGASEEDEGIIPGPDFVNLDEALEAVDELNTVMADEAYVRRLVKKGNGGVGTWFGSVLGVQLFSVEENSEESDGDDTEGELDETEEHQPGQSNVRQFEGITATVEEQIPPPKEDEGGWHDAAWLLTVASKVLL